MAFDAIAERIILWHGLNFALATKYGGPGDLKESRAALKGAIVEALEECSRVQVNTRKEPSMPETTTNAEQPIRKRP